MSDQAITFLLNGEKKTLEAVSPTKTLLQFLREDELLCGTKEGCAEGDCGACTVMVSSLSRDGAVKREAINSCIRFLPSLDGAAVTTVEALSANRKNAHLVQQSMIESHGSQCGFCTPGFIMSLYTGYRNRASLRYRDACDLLAGNLCRCTGYGPILKAAENIGIQAQSVDQKAEQEALDESEQLALAELRQDNSLTVKYAGHRAYVPRSIDELATLYHSHPEATLIAGATDVGLWVTKQLRDLPVVIFLGKVAELMTIEKSGEALTLGAGVSYADAHKVIADLYPDFGELIRRIGSEQVRNAGTIGGNIANGSPIGDTPPALIALGAELVLRNDSARRTIPIEDFYIEYGKQDRAPGEFLESIQIPNPGSEDMLGCYKISKRFDQDISALVGCFNIRIDKGIVVESRIAFGGMAGIPKRASATEKALLSKPWEERTIHAAMKAMDIDFQPLTDVRASAEYRLQTAKNLLLKYFLERKSQPDSSRIVGYKSVF